MGTMPFLREPFPHADAGRLSGALATENARSDDVASAWKYQEAAMTHGPNEKPTLHAENKFKSSETSADRAAHAFFQQTQTSNDPTLDASTEQAKAIRGIAGGLKDLSIALRQIYDRLDEIKRSR
jgi:hypothetical protein